MRTAQITLPALLSMSVRPLRVWLIERRLEQSQRELDVIKMQRKQLEAEERQEHEKQVRLVSRRNAIERGL